MGDLPRSGEYFPLESMDASVLGRISGCVPGHTACSSDDTEEFMTVQDYIHRHYSPAVGESPTGHAIAVLAGLALTVIGAALIVSVVFLPAGIAIGTLGVLVLGAGVFAHITSPLTFADLMDAVIGLSGAAIALTFAVAIVAVVTGFGITVLVSLFRWLMN
jgi:hypothetical protein